MLGFSTSYQPFLTRFNRLSYFFIGGCFVFALGCAVSVVFARTPRFLFAVKDGLLANPQLMGLIGEEAGYDLWYAGEEAPRRTFRVTIQGRCPDARLTVRGTYLEEAYTVTDTLLVKCP